MLLVLVVLKFELIVEYNIVIAMILRHEVDQGSQLNISTIIPLVCRRHQRMLMLFSRLTWSTCIFVILYLWYTIHMMSLYLLYLVDLYLFSPLHVDSIPRYHVDTNGYYQRMLMLVSSLDTSLGFPLHVDMWICGYGVHEVPGNIKEV